jgi:hypothetical protein
LIVESGVASFTVISSGVSVIVTISKGSLAKKGRQAVELRKWTMPDSQRIDPVLVEKAIKEIWDDEDSGEGPCYKDWQLEAVEDAIRVVFDELGLKERDADLEQAWRNGWGSATNALRACDSLATSAHGAEHPDARRILSELVLGWIAQIESLTDNFIESAREIGFASRAHLEGRPVEQGDAK